jgi:hypothetical protein
MRFQTVSNGDEFRETVANRPTITWMIDACLQITVIDCRHA